MRPVQIIDQPPLYPHVCVGCGTGPSEREHFVDLGVETTLVETDEYSARHILDAVIYLCNECIGNLISRYLELLTQHVKNQRTGIQLHNIQNNKTNEIMQSEISHLRNQVLKLEGQLLARDVANNLSEVPQEPSAAEVIGNLFGEKNVGATVNSEGSNDPNAAGSNPDAEGTNKSPYGNSPANESLSASDLLDLKSGKLTATSLFS